jgi:hypothetical protein
VILGSFKDWEIWQDAHNIEAETLILNGKYDEATDLCMEPWSRTIPKVEWLTLENSSHMGHWEERERYMEICGSFLKRWLFLPPLNTGIHHGDGIDYPKYVYGAKGLPVLYSAGFPCDKRSLQ